MINNCFFDCKGTTKKAYMQEIGVKSGDVFEILVICHYFFEKLYNEEL